MKETKDRAMAILEHLIGALEAEPRHTKESQELVGAARMLLNEHQSGMEEDCGEKSDSEDQES